MKKNKKVVDLKSIPRKLEFKTNEELRRKRKERRDNVIKRYEELKKRYLK